MLGSYYIQYREPVIARALRLNTLMRYGPLCTCKSGWPIPLTPSFRFRPHRAAFPSAFLGSQFDAGSSPFPYYSAWDLYR